MAVMCNDVENLLHSSPVYKGHVVLSLQHLRFQIIHRIWGIYVLCRELGSRLLKGAELKNGKCEQQGWLLCIHHKVKDGTKNEDTVKGETNSQSTSSH